MDMETKERMDGLVSIDAKRRLQDASKEIIACLVLEGFEHGEIDQYLKELVKEVGK